MDKKTIMLVCSAGMSTSLLVTKMQEVSKEKGLDTEIFAIPISEVESTIASKELDVILLGPQVRFMQAQIAEKTADKGIPVDVIDMAAYGRMNGEKVLESAFELIK